MHANDFQAFTIAVLPSMVFSRPLSIHVRDIPPDRYHWRLVFRWASKIVCVSDDVRSSVLRIGGALVTDKTVSFPNPVPAIRPQKSLEPDPIALMIGAIEPRKRQASFVEQYSDAVSDAGLKLVLIGETKDHYELARIEAAQRASATIETFGYRSDPLTAMAKASVLISYSLREGLPRVLIEAVAIGVPVLTPMVHGAEQILGNELARFSIVRDDTCAGWAKALAALGTDDWNRAIDDRQEWICSNWSGEALAQKFFLTLTSSTAAAGQRRRMRRLRSLDSSNKMEAAAWYLAHPRFLSDLGRRVAAELAGRVDPLLATAQSAAARTWCGNVVTSAGEALQALGLGETLDSVAAVEPSLWADAVKAAAAGRVQMGGAAHVDLLYAICRRSGASKVIETGVASGWSSLAILLAIRDRPGSRLLSGDLPYLRFRGRGDIGIAVPLNLRERWTLWQRPDREFLPWAVANHRPFDLAHYDSDKSFSGRLFGYHWMWEGLAEGGFLVSDDIEDNLGFKLFSELVGREPFVVEKSRGHFVGILRK